MGLFEKKQCIGFTFTNGKDKKINAIVRKQREILDSTQAMGCSAVRMFGGVEAFSKMIALFMKDSDCNEAKNKMAMFKESQIVMIAQEKVQPYYFKDVKPTQKEIDNYLALIQAMYDGYEMAHQYICVNGRVDPEEAYFYYKHMVEGFCTQL
tara:strand:- start:1443 stop:1898 length:456 start_codon:yes stop_codon:yes gene_type:complete